MTLGEVIAKYCKAQGLSFRQFAEKSNLTSGYISMLVNNKNPNTGEPPAPSIKTYEKVANAMGISLRDLLYETESENPTYYHSVSGEVSRQSQKDTSAKYRSLANEIVRALSKSDDMDLLDDDLWQIREDMRRKPELRTLWDMQRNATKQELKQMEAFIRAIRSSNDYEGDDTP